MGDPEQATGAVPEYEEMPARSGAGGWLFVLLHLAVGGVSLGLALSEDWAAGKAEFSGDAWRGVLALVGAGLTFLALRAAVRTVQGRSPKLTPALHRRARNRGRVLILAGAGLFTMALVAPVADVTISFSGWAKPFYAGAGVYLTLMGLAFQWNPTRTIREQRVRAGEGRPGIARIVRAGDTGVSINDAPQVKIDFEIEVGGRTHLTSDKIVMERAKLALLIPGSTVNVLVDRVDPNVFHVDWDSWKPPAS